jgi:hypothetical protein
MTIVKYFTVATACSVQAFLKGQCSKETTVFTYTHRNKDTVITACCEYALS